MTQAPFDVGLVGATGYAGGELLRLLHRHPLVRVRALAARGRDGEPVSISHPHLALTGHTVEGALPEDLAAVFVALPHGAAAAAMPVIAEAGTAVIDLGPDFRLRDAADYPRWYGFTHPRPELLGAAVYGLPELHRAELAAMRERPLRIVGAPGCYSTAALLALTPLARAGLIGDVVIDAKSGVSGAGREARAEMMFGEVNESVRAYGVGGHRHVAEIEQELGLAAGTPVGPIDFLPHLVPMTRGILAACHVRPSRPTTQAELDAIYADAYAGERFVRVVAEAPATKHVIGSNDCLVYARWDERTGRVLVIAVLDNLVKGAAGQAVQAFNALFGLAEECGLEQLPLAP